MSLRVAITDCAVTAGMISDKDGNPDAVGFTLSSGDNVAIASITLDGVDQMIHTLTALREQLASGQIVTVVPPVERLIIAKGGHLQKGARG